MAAILVSIIVWGIVAFMVADDYCRKHEKNALRFLVAVGMTLTGIGVWGFEMDRFRQVSLHDWILVGFFPIFLLYLRIKVKLVKKISEDQGCNLSLIDLELDAITDTGLVKQHRILSAIVWGYAALVLIVHLWNGSGISI